MDNNCIFCKIINKEIPSYKIYEDEYTYAFLDISNDIEGHTLVVPKEHYANIANVDLEVLNRVMKTVQIISKHYINNLGYTGVNVVNNCGESAGQSVHHLHIHIFPRKDNDGNSVGWNSTSKQKTLEEMTEILKIN